MISNIWATVTSVEDKYIKVKFDNGDISEKLYRYPKNTTPEIGDRAYFMNDVCINIY